MTFKTRLSILLISTPVLAFVVIGGLMGTEAAQPDTKYKVLRVFEDAVQLVMQAYVEPVKVDRVMEGAMFGLADGLDPDSAYLDAKAVKAIESGEPLPEGEVGLELTRQYYLRVIAARDGSPAARAGLHTGDYIRGIDGKPTRDMSVFDGMRMLRGKPGTKVTLTVIRGNAAEPHDIALVREKIAGTGVTSRMIDTVGYIRIPAFRSGVVEDVKRQVAEVSKNGAKALVIDIRRTAEGPLENGIAVARLFVKSGTIAVKAGREAKDQKNPQREMITARPGDGAIELPVTLLVTNGTSGAAELFAAALDGNSRAELIGERTLGRAGVQRLVKLPENRGLWLTSAKYLTVAGKPIHGTGLEPDLVVEDPDVEFGAPAPEKDPILDAALEKVKKSV